MVSTRLKKLTQSVYVEVQERASSLQELLKTVGLGDGKKKPEPKKEKGSDDDEAEAAAEDDAAAGGIEPAQLLEVFSSLFTDTLGAVSAKAQKKVPVPEGLDLEKPI